MTSVEKISDDLYESLLRLKYPGIAQINPEDVTGSVLTQDNRSFLLSWLLAQSSMVKSQEFSNNVEESKLVKWYSNMGICSNPDLLMGKVPLQDQIPTLQNLVLFMKNVLIADVPSSELNDQLLITDVLKKRMGENINIIPANCSLTSKLNYNEAIEYLKGRRKSLSERRKSITESPAPTKHDKSFNEVFGSIGNHNSTCNRETDRTSTVEKFIGAFESASTWSRSRTAESTRPKSMDNYIAGVYSGMATLKETLHSKDQVSNNTTMEKLEIREMPLDGIIEDIVIRIEEVIRLHDID